MQKADGDEAKILAWLAERKKARRELKAHWKIIRETDWEHARARGTTIEEVDSAVQNEAERTEDD